jgi:hypothetical protein
MDVETQREPNLPSRSTQNSKIPSVSHHLIFGLSGLLILIVGMSAVYLWQHQKVNLLNAQVNNMQLALVKDSKISLDNLNALTALPNVVVDTTNSSADLIAFLGSDNTQCYKQGDVGYFKIIAYDSDQFAEMEYGCSAKGSNAAISPSNAFILAKKVNDGWSLINPTNQWLSINGQDLPSCTMVNDNKVSKLVTPQCWEGLALVSPTNNIGAHTVITVTNS